MSSYNVGHWGQPNSTDSSDNCSWISGSSYSRAYSQNTNTNSHLDDESTYSSMLPDEIVHYDNSSWRLPWVVPESSDNETWRSGTSSYRQDTNSQLGRRDENPPYVERSVEYREGRIVHNDDSSSGLWGFGFESSDNESWGSGTSSYSQNTAVRKYQFSITETFRRDWNKIAATEETMRFQNRDNIWRVCQDKKKSQFAVLFPVEVFERDPEIFPWFGYIFDVVSFGYWIYRCAEKIGTICVPEFALETYYCLWELGVNEEKAKTLLGKLDGNSEEKLRLWLRRFSMFLARLKDCVHHCLYTRPSCETERFSGSCYPGFYIAKFFFEDQNHATWMEKYITEVRKFNLEFADDFN